MLYCERRLGSMPSSAATTSSPQERRTYESFTLQIFCPDAIVHPSPQVFSGKPSFVEGAVNLLVFDIKDLLFGPPYQFFPSLMPSRYPLECLFFSAAFREPEWLLIYMDLFWAF